MKVNIYMSGDKIENDEIKNYKCVSEIVRNAVNETYFRYIEELKNKHDGR